MEQKTKIFAAMCIKNESRNIFRVLKGLEGFCDKIVIVDTGSTDGSINIIKQNPLCALYHSTFHGDYSKAKNIPLEIIRSEYSNSNGDWIISIDGDEVLTNQKVLRRKLLSELEFDAFRIIKNHITPSGWFSNESLKIIKNNPNYRYSGTLCELLDPSITATNGKIGMADLYINDLGFLKEPSEVSRKLSRYIKMLQEVLRKEYSYGNALYLSYFFALNGQYRESLDALDFKIGEKDFNRDLQKAYVLNFFGNKNEALKLLRSIISYTDKKNSSLATVYNKLGQIHSEMNDYKNALDNYRHALRLRELDVIITNNYIAYCRNGSRRESEKLKAKVIDTNPYISEARFEDNNVGSINAFNELDPNFRQAFMAEERGMRKIYKL